MIRSFCLLLVTIALVGCATEPQTGHGLPVKPGQLFAGPRLSVKAPPTEGWQLLGSEPGAIVFGREGPGPTESTVASVSDFPVPPEVSGERFTALIRQQLAGEIDRSRFDIKGQAIEPVTERAYPCVHLHQLVVDRRALGSVDPQTLELVGLYCRYPGNANAGFAITYSHRGAQRDPSLPGIAAGFMQGVQVLGR